ncbi:VIN3-like protein 1 isoform X2 [Punica granatum]|uniref:VIN3-like protein 1 isoform X2 n=1 Tax=Punica granatum TaxID=22663 RepID=A0A6P8CCZ9_PUNGR|nr:VIN3-like protein 1 isoform X2 [Punica granatum]XP_031380295.1 VIN3-like protein 1 isoform X2 [Punica granatum]
MELEDKFLLKGIRSLSSSVQSTPEKNGHSDDASRSPELLQEFLKSGLRKELLRASSNKDKDKKNPASSKSKMREPSKPSNNKTTKKQESRKASNSPPSQPSSKKQNRKGEHPIRIPLAPEHSRDLGYSKSFICKNSACRGLLSPEDAFCRRCSCYICHSFDDNKDPSLWLVCSSEDEEEDTCGFSCHIECALQREKAGVVNLGQLMTLDGSYCCASCGKVYGILRWWKKQLAIAKDARHLDVLCYRIYLSYRLLNGTSRFKALHGIVTDAKAKLETEVGPINGISAKMARGIVSRLLVANDVQMLCSLGIEKAEELLAKSMPEDSGPPSCKILFEEVNPSSVGIILIDSSSSGSSQDIKGYKLWYCKSEEETYSKEPACVFPRDQRRISVSNLQPCTEYTFRLISFTEMADLGRSEAKCFTRSTEIFHRHSNSTHSMSGNKERAELKSTNNTVGSSGFKVRDLENILQAACGQNQRGHPEGFCTTDTEKCCRTMIKLAAQCAGKDQAPPVSCGLDLNVASVPDLNEEATPLFENSGDGEDVLGMHNTVHSLGSRGNSGDEMCRKRAITKEEAHDSDSTLINGSNSPSHISNGSGCLDENFGYCVKTVRRLECGGLIDREFRLKFLTWFSLRSSEQERRVVNTFVQTMVDDPSSLAGQLVDSFSEIMSTKRHRTALCSSNA